MRLALAKNPSPWGKQMFTEYLYLLKIWARPSRYVLPGPLIPLHCKCPPLMYSATPSPSVALLCETWIKLNSKLISVFYTFRSKGFRAGIAEKGPLQSSCSYFLCWSTWQDTKLTKKIGADFFCILGNTDTVGQFHSRRWKVCFRTENITAVLFMFQLSRMAISFHSVSGRTATAYLFPWFTSHGPNCKGEENICLMVSWSVVQNRSPFPYLPCIFLIALIITQIITG